MTQYTGRALRMSYLVAGVAGVVFFVLSVALLAIWPGRVLERQSQSMSPSQPLALTASEQRGRLIYGREGCAYCHTQQVRYVAADTRRFGAPTLAWETRLDYPQLWGTRRIGPDLARATQTRSEDWHFAHLFSPRGVVSDSVMPAYPWLFDGAADRPHQAARDLVAYLETLGRARELAAPEGEDRARTACDCEDDEVARLAFSTPLINANPARTRPSGGAPPLPPTTDDARGRVLYAEHCATCHGTRGEGDGAGAASLRPRPANLAEHQYTRERLGDALWNGVAGTSMSAWRDRPLADLSAIAQAVQALNTTRDESSTPPALVDLGAIVYEANCVQCHGVGGAGDGFASRELTIAPTNFRLQRPSLAESLRALRNGVDGTPMAPWTGRLSDAELVAVAHHVRRFYSGGRPGQESR